MSKRERDEATPEESAPPEESGPPETTDENGAPVDNPSG